MMFLKFKISALVLLSCFFVQAQINQELLYWSSVSDDRLWRALKAQNVERVKKLLKEGSNPNAPNLAGLHPLHMVRNAEIAKVLLEDDGIKTDVKDEYGATFLHYMNDTQIATVKVLLEDERIKPDATDSNENTPLHYFLINHMTDTEEVTKALLEAGANPNAPNKAGRTPLHVAENMEAAKVLLNAEGIDINARNKYKRTPLHTAKNMELAKILLEAGADLNAKDEDGRTPADVNQHVREVLRERERLEIERKASSDDTYSCKYTSDLSTINPTQCGRRSLCMAEVSCKINIGGSRVEKTYQAVCSALTNGNCPTADNCVQDRSVVETDVNRVETNTGAASSSSSSSQSSQGVR